MFKWIELYSRWVLLYLAWVSGVSGEKGKAPKEGLILRLPAILNAKIFPVLS